jgi:hypothetical protein
MKLPTLSKLREHILKEKLTGHWGFFGGGLTDVNARFFQGNCHYASVALSLLLTDSGRFVERGWYTEVNALRHDDSWIRNRDGHIAHSWIEYKGKIIDPTWWAFHPGEEVKIYTFSIKDKRYSKLNPR